MISLMKNRTLESREPQEKMFTDFSNNFDDIFSTQNEESNPAQSHQNFHSASTSPISDQPKKRARKTSTEKSQTPKTRHARPTKNITINYGKAIASFAVSPLAIPYVEDHLIEAHLTHIEFVNFIYTVKDSIGGIEGFKSLLQINDNDESKVKIYKRLFKRVSEVFIKYFSVNWIIHGKVSNKLVYLQFRGKMLRRVRNPEAFTYIKKRAKKAKI